MEGAVAVLSPVVSNPWTEYIDFALVWGPIAGLTLSDGASILDIGSGDGRIVRALASRGYRAIGLEIRPSNGTTVVGRAEALPFKDEIFDLTLMVLVLMHITAAPQALRELRRVTKRGGSVLVAVGNRRSYTGLAFRERSPRFLRRKVPYDHYLSYNQAELAEALSRAGLRVVSVRSVTYVPRVVGKAPASMLRGLLPIVRWAEAYVACLPLLRRMGVRLLAFAERP